MDCVIEPAKSEDATRIAQVHIQSWQESYVGLIPQDYLNSMDNQFERRRGWWSEVIVSESCKPLVARSGDLGVVGFVQSGPARNNDFQDMGEVYCIYLLQAFQGQGVGYRLLKETFMQLRQQGFENAYLWVLENNPTISFYHRTGGRFSGRNIEATVGGKNVVEQQIVWDSLVFEEG